MISEFFFVALKLFYFFFKEGRSHKISLSLKFERFEWFFSHRKNKNKEKFSVTSSHINQLRDDFSRHSELSWRVRVCMRFLCNVNPRVLRSETKTITNEGESETESMRNARKCFAADSNAQHQLIQCFTLRRCFDILTTDYWTFFHVARSDREEVFNLVKNSFLTANLDKENRET